MMVKDWGSIITKSGLRRSGRIRSKQAVKSVGGGGEEEFIYYKVMNETVVELQTIPVHKTSTFKLITHPRFNTDSWSEGQEMIEEIKRLEQQYRKTHPGVRPIVCFDIDDTLLVSNRHSTHAVPCAKTLFNYFVNIVENGAPYWRLTFITARPSARRQMSFDHHDLNDPDVRAARTDFDNAGYPWRAFEWYSFMPVHLYESVFQTPSPLSNPDPIQQGYKWRARESLSKHFNAPIVFNFGNKFADIICCCSCEAEIPNTTCAITQSNWCTRQGKLLNADLKLYYIFEFSSAVQWTQWAVKFPDQAMLKG